MKFLLFFLLIPMAFADSPPGCDELSKIVQDYEKGLQSKYIGAPNTGVCSSLKLEDMLTSDESGRTTAKDLVDTVIQQDPSYFNDRRCSPLSSIELELERLKNEEAVLSGIDKLKNELQTSQVETGNANLAAAREAGTTFVSALTTAQSVELLLQSKNQKDENFLTELKKLPLAQRKNLVDFQARVAELCRTTEKGDVANACDNKIFKPTQGAVDEINAMIDQAEPNERNLQNWQRSIAIRKRGATPEEATYSFTQMRQEMESGFDKLDKGERLTRQELKVIRNLDQFENAPGFSFVEDLALAKDKFKNQFKVDEFRFLVEDAQLRQKHEVQSRVSLVWADAGPGLSGLEDRARTACTNAKTSYDDALVCYAAMNGSRDQITDSNAKANLDSLMKPLDASIDYVNKLSTLSGQCLEDAKKNGVLSPACANEVGADKALIQKKILTPNLLKEKIGTENQKNMAYRNFALYKLNTQQCNSKLAIDSSLEFCDLEDGANKISKAAMLLTSNVMDISLVYAPKPEAESVAESLCDQEDQKNNTEERLCAFFNDTTSNIIKTDNAPKTDPSDATTVAPTREGASPTREAWLTGINNALQTIAGQMRPPAAVSSGIAPYPYNFNAYSTTAPMGIADTILFNARYQGAYGYYMPTKGYQPYTAFGTASKMVTPYTSVKASTTTYFGTFGK